MISHGIGVPASSEEDVKLRMHKTDCSPQLTFLSDIEQVVKCPSEKKCFEQLRFDARATYGAPVGVNMIFEMKIICKHALLPSRKDDKSRRVHGWKEVMPSFPLHQHSCRIGFSNPGELGELGVRTGVGYGSTGKFSQDKEFINAKDLKTAEYNTQDTVAAAIQWEHKVKTPTVIFFKNGIEKGRVVYKPNKSQIFLPHINLKNVDVSVNFDRSASSHGDDYPSHFRFPNEVFASLRRNPVPEFESFGACTLILLQGLPGSGKTTLARSLLQSLPGTCILSSNDFIDSFKVPGLKRAHAYDVRFKHLIIEAQLAMEESIKIMPPRNYILDQTNCFVASRACRLPFFAKFGVRIALVCIPTVTDYARNLVEAVQEDRGKHIPLAVFAGKGAKGGGKLTRWEFPTTNENFTDILYVGCKPSEANQRLEDYKVHLGVTQKRPVSHQGPDGGRENKNSLDKKDSKSLPIEANAVIATLPLRPQTAPNCTNPVAAASEQIPQQQEFPIRLDTFISVAVTDVPAQIELLQVVIPGEAVTCTIIARFADCADGSPGAIERDGRVAVGDELVSINDVETRDMFLTDFYLAVRKAAPDGSSIRWFVFRRIIWPVRGGEKSDEDETVTNINEDETVPNINEDEKVTNINEDEKVPNINEDEKVPNINEDEKVPNINEDEKVPNINEDEKVTNINEDEKVPNINEDEKVTNINTSFFDFTWVASIPHIYAAHTSIVRAYQSPPESSQKLQKTAVVEVPKSSNIFTKYFDEGVIRATTSRAYLSSKELGFCAKLDVFFQALPVTATQAPSKGTLWYSGQSLVTWRMVVPNSEEVCAAVREITDEHVSVWPRTWTRMCAAKLESPEVLQKPVRTICLSTRAASNEASSALVRRVSHVLSAAAMPDHAGLTHVRVIATERDGYQNLDKKFRRLLDALSLWECDEKDLSERGLLREQIDQSGFKTWPGGPVSVPHLTSEYHVSETTCYVKPALFIPARNSEGLIVAIHTKPHTPGEKGGKYMWASCNKSMLLPGGGMPLFCCCYDWTPCHTVALIEGGLKAYVFTHLAARIKVIGASGGQFWQSPNELISSIARFGARKVVLFPDAGAIRNPCVILDYFRTFEVLRTAADGELEIGVAWWGQESKVGHDDADDLLQQISDTDIGAMRLLSVADLWALVPRCIQHALKAGKHRYIFASFDLNKSISAAATGEA